MDLLLVAEGVAEWARETYTTHQVSVERYGMHLVRLYKPAFNHIDLYFYPAGIVLHAEGFSNKFIRRDVHAGQRNIPYSDPDLFDKLQARLNRIITAQYDGCAP